MRVADHEIYAKTVLSSISDGQPETDNVRFIPNRAQSRNAAHAMTAILCHRLFKKSGEQPKRIRSNTYAWKEGVLNNRNITDRNYLWSNMRRHVADVIHQDARKRPVAYLLAFSSPSDTRLCTWAIPEHLLHDSLSRLPPKAGGQEYTIQIFANKQRIAHDPASPDLSSYFAEFPLSQHELRVLKESRDVDALVRRERPMATGQDEDDLNTPEDDFAEEAETRMLLTAAAQILAVSGYFDPANVADARDHLMSSIVCRRGQPRFRQQLLLAYKGQCAISGCDVESVLEAAHIVPYMGPDTNHIGNGLLLRADLHTLFDLKLIAIDTEEMRLVVSLSLVNTCYEELRDMPIRLPDDPQNRPSPKALNQHRQESCL